MEDGWASKACDELEKEPCSAALKERARIAELVVQHSIPNAREIALWIAAGCPPGWWLAGRPVDPDARPKNRQDDHAERPWRREYAPGDDEWYITGEGPWTNVMSGARKNWVTGKIRRADAERIVAAVNATFARQGRSDRGGDDA